MGPGLGDLRWSLWNLDMRETILMLQITMERPQVQIVMMQNFKNSLNHSTLCTQVYFRRKIHSLKFSLFWCIHPIVKTQSWTSNKTIQEILNSSFCIINQRVTSTCANSFAKECMISHCFVTFVLYNLAFSWNIWIYITKNIKDHFNIEKQQTNLN